MKPSQLVHRYVDNAALPYDPLTSPISRESVYVAGSNILTSIRQYAERRPGFPSSYEPSNATTFGSIKRMFAWKRWNGSYYVMLNDVVGGVSKVYSLQVGVDNTFVLQFSDASNEPFDFVTSNNYCYMANGLDMQRFDGTSTKRWGIPAPTVAPTTTLAAGVLSATAGYRYLYSYQSASSTHVSSVSPITISTDPANAVFTNKKVTVSGTGSGSADLNVARVFRTTDGGSGVYFEIANSPVSNANIAWTVDDETLDANLKTIKAPTNNTNDDWTSSGRSAWKGLILFAGRIWGFYNNAVYYTAFEEVIGTDKLGVPEESFPPTNKFTFGDEVTALAVANEGVLVFTGSTINKISGDSIDTFRRDPLFKRLGTRNRANVANVGKSVAWLDTGNTMRITDGYSQVEFGEQIRPDIASINQSASSVCFHNDGLRQWLLLNDSGAGKIRTYDVDEKAQRWMPPWSTSAASLSSLEVSTGTFKLIAGSSKPLAMNYNAYNDNGSVYAASMTTNLLGLTKTDAPGHTGVVEYVGLERSNGSAPTDVKQSTDEDPAVSGNFSSILANKVDPDFRTPGMTLIEEWYKSRQPLARRAAVQITWPAEDQNFKLYGLDLASSEQPDQ